MAEYVLSSAATNRAFNAIEVIEVAAKAAIECLVWSEEPDGENWRNAPIHPEVAYSVMKDIASFLAVDVVYEVARRNELDPEFIGHNFYLTANGHGTGYWDKKLPRGGEDILHHWSQSYTRRLYMDEEGNLRSE